MNTEVATMDNLVGPLAIINKTPLREIRAEHTDRVVRRIVDKQALLRRLDVAAFQSAH
ncbi:FxSxx-COOH cyclophane-containing RiPP peptide [Jidongwangia harbinensis]|uniref:FxSxx-COOH cyclophane-containing RiPP peptide n=1 Tax=Jidongwangia harbinensis TaxID=2878561 RepID=UPI001CD9358F|nr:FxSxx-COOH cyclophane-containing RiPP peptide [Jidongwangia harbinensis]MCA2215731.1 FXSXX-COOH protein [Jidongwangia harbinensis]